MPTRIAPAACVFIAELPWLVLAAVLQQMSAAVLDWSDTPE
jgi:hypothetical protein